jgi:hypothetical protein
MADSVAGWAQELVQTAQADFFDQRERAFAEIEQKLGDKVICSACGCTVATFGERCGAPSMAEFLATGETCEGIIAIVESEPATPELAGLSFVMDRRGRIGRLKFTFGPAPSV